MSAPPDGAAAAAVLRVSGGVGAPTARPRKPRRRAAEEAEEGYDSASEAKRNRALAKRKAKATARRTRRGAVTGYTEAHALAVADAAPLAERRAALLARRAAPSNLPEGVLREVLAAAAASGALPTAAYVPCVSRAFRDAARAEPRLWEHADLSYGWAAPTDAAVRRLCKGGAWALTRRLSLAGCGALTDDALAAVGEACAGSLEALDLTGCDKFSGAAVRELAARCGRLCDVTLDRGLLRPRSDFDANVRGVLEARGETLTSLSLAHCALLRDTALKALARCPQLRVLRLDGSVQNGAVLPVEALQAGCPLLEELRVEGLGQTYGFRGPVPAPRDSPGWPHLRVCEAGVYNAASTSSMHSPPSGSYVDDALLVRMLGGSPLLEELGLGGVQAALSVEGLERLPAERLRRVAIPASKLACDEAVAYIAERWGAGLDSLDASASGGCVTAGGVLHLALHAPRLSEVGLMSSAVDDGALGALLNGCPRLARVELDGCRSLSRPVRQAAHDGGVRKLRRMLSLND